MNAPAQLIEAAAAHEAQLRQVREGTEARFLRAGDALISVCDRFEALETPLAALAELAASGEVQEMTQAIRSFTASLQTLLETGHEGRAPLESTLAMVHRMRVGQAQLARTIRTMNIVALNARVVVAQIPDPQGSLSVFTRDARDLVQRSILRLETVEEALAQLELGVEAVRLGSEALAQLFGGSAADVLAEIATGIETFEAHLGSLMARGSKLSRVSEGIRTSVGQSVLALQSGDAMRQRLDHSEAALRAAQSAVPGAGLAAAFLALVRRQIVDLAAHYKPQLLGLERQIGQASVKTAEFLAQVEEAFRPGNTGVARLRESVVTIEEMLAGVARQQSELAEGAQRITICAARVQAEMQEISRLEARMNLIGVNAVVACTGLGPEGLPLTVIAHQLRDLVAESGRCSAGLQRDLAQMNGAVQEVAQRLAAQAEQVAAIRAESEARITQSLGHLRGALENTRNAITGNRLLLTAALQDGLGALVEQRAALDWLVRDVAAQISAKPRMRRFTLSEGEAALVAQLRAGLSIEAERKLHDSWLGTIGVSAPAAPPPAPVPADEWFFNEAS